ncbi:hypothetical protein [Sphingobacterium multivorum]|uniref:hypothetical protein n=1 Tax=Sphingobacterium multivorum TaxID=28454 RepID=UPI0028A7CA8B|nr:hypothetical protein [Sphingobacterium multivorum]
MTHSQLIAIGIDFVKKRFRYPLVFSEIMSAVYTGEIPDIIAFGAFNKSIVLECKISRSDFLRDRKKPFRLDPSLGMGKYRFYIAPVGIIHPSDLPERWGLIVVDSEGRADIKVNPYCKTSSGNIWFNGFEQNFKAERALLFSVLRRIK